MVQNINNDYKFGHFPQENGKGGLTIGWTKVDNNIIFSLSSCSDKDYYTKSIGRDLCKQRIENNDFDTLEFDFLKSIYSDKLELEDDIFSFAKRKELVENFSIEDLSYGFIRDIIIASLVLEVV